MACCGELAEVTVAGADGPEVYDRGVVVFGDISGGNRIFMDIHSDVLRAKLWHG